MRLAALLAAVSLFASFFASGTAHGDDVDPDTEIARRHFEAGRMKYEANDYAGALREFEAARKVRPMPAFDYNIARCLDRLERPSEAVDAYQRYLSAIGNAPDAAEVRDRVQVLEQRLGVSAKPAPVSSRKNTRLLAPAIMTGGALALAVVGAALVGSVKADYDRLLSGPDSCRPCSDAQVSPLEARANAGYALFGLAGALAIVDVILWVRAARRPR
jgi:hypothetical protein